MSRQDKDVLDSRMRYTRRTIFSIKNEIYVNYNDNSVAYYVKVIEACMSSNVRLICVLHSSIKVMYRFKNT